MLAGASLDWSEKLLYLAIVAAVLLLGAIVVHVICYCSASNGREEEEVNEVGERSRRQELAAAAPTATKGKTPLAAAAKQTMYSSLRQSGSARDVVLATATSAIPLKELGGKGADILVDVSQQMYLNKEELGHQDVRCGVCRAHKDIEWNQVSCYAQTTIGVLVYKRTALATDAPRLTSAAAADQLLQKQKQFNERSRTDSNLSLAPNPDSRLSIASRPKKSPVKAPSIKSAKSSSKSPPDRRAAKLSAEQK